MTFCLFVSDFFSVWFLYWSNLVLSLFISVTLYSQTVGDDFEGNGNITTWFGDACGMNNNFINPYQQGINSSATVLQYNDTGGQYANVRFDVAQNFDFSSNSEFSLKIYVPSSGISGTQPNQVSYNEAILIESYCK